MGSKYTHSFSSYGSSSFSWEIHQDGFVGSPTSMVASGRGHTKINWKMSEDIEVSPIMPSEATVTLIDPSNAIVDDILSAVEGGVSDLELIIKDSGGNIFWRGQIETRESIAFSEDHVNVLTISATDGLGSLDDKPYAFSVDPIVLFADAISRPTVVDLLLGILGFTGMSLEMYTASNIYPKTTPALTGADDPLNNEYVDRAAFRDPGPSLKDKAKPISAAAALQNVLRRFGLVLFQSEGAWHAIQFDLLFSGTYRRWHYNAVAAPIGTPNYADYNPDVVVASDASDRTTSEGSFLKPYSAVAVKHNHGLYSIIRNPGFEPIETISGTGVPPSRAAWWDIPSGNGRFNFSGSSRSEFVGGVDGIPIFPVESFGQGTDLFSWDGLINSSLTSGRVGRVTQTSDTISAGTQLLLSSEYFLEILPGVNIESASAKGKYRALIQVCIETDTINYYFTSSGTWTITVTWIPVPAKLGAWETVFIEASAATPVDGKIKISIGPAFEFSGKKASKSIHWDNVRLDYVLPDGTDRKSVV